MEKKTSSRSVVKTGGVAHDTADTEDVTRDTYGVSQTHRTAGSRAQRIAESDREAAALGVPGVDVREPAPAASPDQTPEERDREERDRADEFRRAEHSGDRAASPRDAEKARIAREKKPR